MKSNIIFFVLCLIVGAAIIPGCSQFIPNTDRWSEGEPKYDTEGHKVKGDDLTIDEVYEYQVVMGNIRNLDTKPSSQEFSNIMNDRGQLLVYIVNNSGNRFNVIICNSRGTKVMPKNLGPHSYLPVYLNPGKGYTAYFDGGGSPDKRHCFDVMPTIQASYELIYRDGSREFVDCAAYLYKD